MTFPKIQGILHLRDKVLEINQKGDLLEVFLLNKLDDWWQQFDYYGDVYDLNLYNDGKEYCLTIYNTGLTENDEIFTLHNEFKKLELKIEE